VKDTKKDIAQFWKVARELLRIADKLDEQCKTQTEKDKLSIVYQTFLVEFMK
jgi:hypothetical protein